MSSASGGQTGCENVGENIHIVRQKMTSACLAAGRAPDSVRLLAVSKTFSAAAIRAAYASGQDAFGESYLQEAVEKLASLADLPLEWHFIGPIQSNKTRQIAESFSWVHAVDRLKIAERLAAQRPAQLPALNLCVQVNISGEASKAGVAPAQTLELARAISALPGIRLRGLMAIPEPLQGAEAQRVPFRRLRELLAELRAAGLDCDTLSMGMSDDLEAAITEGATIVRVGTAIFGRRPDVDQHTA
ncbi:MAG: alanine racemase, N-terminal domain protein [Betaproteobacteria bacterium]|nr:alanine racemase, N-terminal domain protein [Betaproteobacteria bacterium]